MQPEQDDNDYDEPEDDYMIEDTNIESGDPEVVTNGNSEQVNLTGRPFTVLSPLEILKLAESDIEYTNEVLCLGEEWALVVLDHFDWDVEKCKSSYFSNPSLVKEICGYTKNKQKIWESKQEKQCVNCTFPRKEFFLLGCQHTNSCVECSTDYIIFQLKSFNPIAKCMHVGCQTPFLRSSIEFLLRDSKKDQVRFHQALAKASIKKNPNFKQCIGKDCEMFIYRKDPAIQEVTCSCGMKFCFLCNEEAHRPSNCANVQQWKVAVYEHPSTNWLRRYTRMCPNCNITVERIDGCNQIVCPKPKGCGTKFCYICSQTWAPTHKYPFKCPLFKDKSNNIQRQRKIFEMVNINFAQFVASNIKTEIMRDFLKDFKQIQLDLFQILDIDYLDSAGLQTPFLTLLNSFNILKWSYVVTHYTPKHQYLEIFLYQQESAQNSINELYSYVIERLMNFWKKLKPRSEEELQDWVPIDPIERREVFQKLKNDLIREAKVTEGYVKTLQHSAENELRS